MEEEDRRFTVLYEEGFAPVYKAALMLCGRRDLAEDATQEAFARALERWDRIGGEPWPRSCTCAGLPQTSHTRVIASKGILPARPARILTWSTQRRAPSRYTFGVPGLRPRPACRGPLSPTLSR